MVSGVEQLPYCIISIDLLTVLAFLVYPSFGHEGVILLPLN